jgi:hypothetical protein
MASLSVFRWRTNNSCFKKLPHEKINNKNINKISIDYFIFSRFNKQEEKVEKINNVKFVAQKIKHKQIDEKV